MRGCSEAFEVLTYLSEADDSGLQQRLSELECKSGGHYLYVYDSLEALRRFYPARCKYALDHNIVTVFLSYYEPAKTVYAYLENAGIDVDKSKRSNSLFVLDAIHQFFGSGPDFYHFLKLLDKGAAAQDKNGVCVLASLDAFVLQGDVKQTIEFEHSIQVQNLNSTSMICMYHVESFVRLPVNVQEEILEQHQIVVR